MSIFPTYLYIPIYYLIYLIYLIHPIHLILFNLISSSPALPSLRQFLKLLQRFPAIENIKVLSKPLQAIIT